MGVRFPEEKREWRIYSLFYVDDLNLCEKLGRKPERDGGVFEVCFG